MANDDGKEATTKELKEIEIAFPDELKKGVFSNNVFIAHTAEEFILDFLSVAPPAGSVVARIVMTPSHLKRFIKALSINLDKYEETFGEVPEEISPK